MTARRLDTWADLRDGLTLYMRLGDLFALVCLVFSVLACSWCVLLGRTEGMLLLVAADYSSLRELTQLAAG